MGLDCATEKQKGRVECLKNKMDGERAFINSILIKSISVYCLPVFTGPPLTWHFVKTLNQDQKRIQVAFIIMNFVPICVIVFLGNSPCIHVLYACLAKLYTCACFMCCASLAG